MFQMFLTLASGDPPVDQTHLLGPIINLGAVGVCLIVLALYFVKERKQYERRIDERLELEKSFRQEQAAQQVEFRRESSEMEARYRSALEKVTLMLDSMERMLERLIDRREE